jgi:hypothetical protein
MVDLCDLARFPWQYNPFSCLVVPHRGMRFPLEKRRKQDFLAYGCQSPDASGVVCQGMCHEVPRQEPDCLCHQN